MFPEGAPQRHINWKDEGYELFVGALGVRYVSRVSRTWVDTQCI